jgi:hypothetical protein
MPEGPVFLTRLQVGYDRMVQNRFEADVLVSFQNLPVARRAEAMLLQIVGHKTANILHICSLKGPRTNSNSQHFAFQLYLIQESYFMGR